MNRLGTIILSLLWMTSLAAQNGGRSDFGFLSLPSSARLTALGSSAVSIADGDVSLAMSNPASLDSMCSSQIQLSYDHLFSDIYNATASYATRWERYKLNIHGGLSYARYGNFTRADIFGNKQGSFSGGETAIVIGASKKIKERIHVGMNIKGILGSIDAYNASGAAMDIGCIYTVPESNLNIGLVVKNLGITMDGYGSKKSHPPLDIQLGISKKLRFLPFRYAIIFHQLQRWQATYDDPARRGKDAEGNPIISENSVVDNFFRHVIINGEFLLGKGGVFKLRVGYNHLRRKELSVSEFRSLAGFSFGAGISLRGFKIDYGLGFHHLVGANNHVTIRTNLSRFL